MRGRQWSYVLIERPDQLLRGQPGDMTCGGLELLVSFVGRILRAIARRGRSGASQLKSKVIRRACSPDSACTQARASRSTPETA